MSQHDLFGQPATPAPRIRVGIGGWTYAPWRNDFYPSGLARKRELEFASRQLTTIEINGTWYGAQKPATYARWAAQTPAGFVFSLKAPRYCTEARRLAETERTVRGFVEGGLSELGDRLGPILWQFAPQRAFEREDFAVFLERLPRALDGVPLRHVLEVRHASFMCAEYLALARAHRLPTVFTDSPEHPSFADPTGEFIYARLMRSALDQPDGYPPEALDAWARRARLWSEGGEPSDLPRVRPTEGSERGPTRDVFVYFIGAGKARNPAAARGLSERLGRGNAG